MPMVTSTRRRCRRGSASPRRGLWPRRCTRELGQLSAVSASELLQLHGMGPKAIAVLESALAEAGLSLRRD